MKLPLLMLALLLATSSCTTTRTMKNCKKTQNDYYVCEEP